MPLQLTSAPVIEPLSLAEVKSHLRVDIPDDDALIGALISATRFHAETITRRAFIAQSWKLVMDSFPGPTMIGIPWGKPFTLPDHAILIEKSPVRLINSINYLAMNGTYQVMPSNLYTADLTSEPCRVTPIFGQIWPIPMPQIGAVEADFVAGYAAPVTFTVANNTLNVSGAWKPYAVGDTVQLSNVGGALPAALLANGNYVISSVVSPGVYTLAATAGGPVIGLSDPGSGTSLVGVVPEGIKAWMKARITSLYEERSEVAIPERGKIQPLPFIDRLLDPYTVVF